LNTLDSVCGKHELDWTIKGWKVNVLSLLKLLLKPAKKDPCKPILPFMGNESNPDKPEPKGQRTEKRLAQSRKGRKERPTYLFLI
jgi:hypothetical protein